MKFYEDLLGVFVKVQFPAKKSVLVEAAKDILGRVVVARGLHSDDVKLDLKTVESMESQEYSNLNEVKDALLASEAKLEAKADKQPAEKKVVVKKAVKGKGKGKK